MSRLSRARLAALLTLVPAVAATAQSRDTTRADSARKLTPVVVTETREAGTVGGASSVVIRPEALRASPAPLLEQALRESPFVHVRQNSRGEMELSVRGSDSRQAAVILDGVPLSLGWDHRADPSLIPITGAQSLVIVRGLGSVLNGPNTLGGTIEIAHDANFHPPPGTQVWGGAGVDENAAYVASVGAGRTMGNLRGGALAMRAGLAHRQRDGFSLPAGAVDPSAREGLRTNSDLRQTDAFGSLRWTSALGRTLGITVSGFDAERGVPPEEHLASPRLWRYPYNTRAVAALSGSTGSFATPLGFGAIDLGAGYNAGRLKIETYADRRFETVTGEERGGEHTATSRLAVRHSLPWNASLNAAATVADVRYTETLGTDAPARYRQQLWSAGAEVDMPLGTRTVVSGGIVHDRSSTPETGGRTAQAPFTHAGWRAGLTFDATREWRLHASTSERARFPALRELYSGALNRFQANPALRPETLRGIEAGFIVDRSWGPIPDGTIQLTGFHHRLDDAVVRITLPDRRFRRINRDRITSSGAELMGGFVFGADRDRAATLTGDATIQSIALQDATAEGNPARHAENNPERRGMLELGMPLPAAFRGFANARYTGVQYCLNSDSGTEMRLPARTEADVALERTIRVAPRGGWVTSLRALLSLDNVGNTAVFDQCGLPQPGRTLRLMITVR